MKRQTEISIETHEIKIIRIRNGVTRAFCSRCQSERATFTPTQIAVLFQMSLIEIARDIETGRFHLTGNGRGTALICGDFLQS